MKLGDARVFSVPTFSSDRRPGPRRRWTAGSRAASGHRWPRPASGSCSGTDSSCRTPADAPVGTIVFRNRRALFSWVWDPDLNFGEAYMFGAVEIRGDLVAMLERDLSRARRARRARALVAVAAHRTTSTPPGRTCIATTTSGNEFYRLWLDREMVYTCAYFPTPDATLEEAQIAKMDRVCRKLQAAGRANAWSKRDAAGDRWRCSWPGSTA